MTRSRLTAAATFAHLLGFAKHADEGDDEKDKARRAEEDDGGDDDATDDSPNAKRQNAGIAQRAVGLLGVLTHERTITPSGSILS